MEQQIKCVYCQSELKKSKQLKKLGNAGVCCRPDCPNYGLVQYEITERKTKKEVRGAR